MNEFTAIFRAGTHTDTSGVTRAFSTDDLDRVAQEYNPEKHEAPLVIGHPKTDSPAFGWVEELKRDGDKLLAKFRQVPEEVKELVREGRYKHVSVALYPQGGLRHVGLLGATPPAIKGLGPVQFGEDEAEFRSYESHDEPAKPRGDSMDVEELKAKLAAAEAKAAEAEQGKAESDAKAAEAEKAKAALEAQFAEHKASEQAKAREAHFSELVKAGKLLPGEKELVLGLAGALAAAPELTFSEGGGEVKKTAEAALWQFLEARPANDLLGEFAEHQDDGGQEAKPDGNYAAAF